MSTAIKRYRMVAFYPYRIIEAEALVDGKTVYVDLDVDSIFREKEKEDEPPQAWTFSLPIDAEDRDDAYADITDAEETEIVEQMAAFWRRRPVFADSFDEKLNNWAWTIWDQTASKE